MTRTEIRNLFSSGLRYALGHESHFLPLVFLLFFLSSSWFMWLGNEDVCCCSITEGCTRQQQQQQRNKYFHGVFHCLMLPCYSKNMIYFLAVFSRKTKKEGFFSDKKINFFFLFILVRGGWRGHMYAFAVMIKKNKGKVLVREGRRFLCWWFPLFFFCVFFLLLPFLSPHRIHINRALEATAK